MQRMKKARPPQILVVPRVASSSSLIMTIACPICDEQHTYLRSEALPPQTCPQQPESGIALFIVPPDAVSLCAPTEAA
jgi:hypothetical protein